MKAIPAFCTLAMLIFFSTVGVAMAKVSEDRIKLTEQKKWVVVPTQVTDKFGQPYLIRAYLQADQVCGIMKKENQARCYIHWNSLEREPWLLQDDEAEIYADPDQAMLIRITEEVLCKLMDNEQERSSLTTPETDCHDIWSKKKKD